MVVYQSFTIPESAFIVTASFSNCFPDIGSSEGVWNAK